MAQTLTDYWITTTHVLFSASAGSSAVGNVPINTLVDRAYVLISSSFGGTSPTIDFGTGGNGDVLVDNTNVAAGTVGAYSGSGGGSLGASGLFFPAGSALTLTIGGTDLTAGEAYGVLHCLDLGEA